MKSLVVAGPKAHLGIREVEFVHAAGHSDIEKTAFLLERARVFDAAAAWKHSVGEPDEEDDFPLEALGLVECGEGHFLGFGSSGKGLCCFQSTEQGKLGEKIRCRFKLPGEFLQRHEVIVAGVVVREFLLHVVLVNGEEDARDHLGRLHRSCGRSEVAKGMDKLVPRLLSFGRNFQAGEVCEIGFPIKDRGGLLPECLGGFVSDSRKHADHALECGFIAWVDGEFQKSGDILDVGLLKKSKPAGDAEGNASSGELELHLHRVVVGAVEHSDLLKWHALVREFHDSLSDEGSLLVVVW